MSSLAQDELGHAAALYGLLGDLTGSDADALAYDREPHDYRHCRLLDHGRGDWAMTIARRFLYDSADVVRLEALAERIVGSAGRARRQAPARGALPPDARRRVARPAGPGRRRGRATGCWPRSVELGPDAATVFTPLPGEPALIEAGILAAPMTELETRWRDTIRPTFAQPRPADAAAGPRPRAWPARPRRGVPLAVGRVHLRPPVRSGGDLVSEMGIQVGVARIRAGVVTGSATAPGPRPVDESAVRAALAEVMDPELPMLSVVDLGIIHRVEVDARRPDPGRDPADLRGLPCARADQAVDRGEARHLRAPGRGRGHVRGPVDIGAHQRGRSGRPARGRDRAARPGFRGFGRRRSHRPRAPRPVPALRLAPDPPREPVRPDGLPDDPLLRRLPPAVRSDQAGLT